MVFKNNNIGKNNFRSKFILIIKEMNKIFLLLTPLPPQNGEYQLDPTAPKRLMTVGKNKKISLGI